MFERLKTWWTGRRAESTAGEQPRAEKKAADNPTRARTIYGTSAPRPTLTEKQTDHAEKVNEALRLAMLGLGPGWWASDHAEEAQHFTSWNYVAIHGKAKQSMQATARVYRKSASKADTTAPRTKATAADQQEVERTPLPETHDAAKLLERPNARWSGPLFRYMISQQLNLTGSALLWKVRDRGGKLAELWVVPTGLARPQMPSAQFPLGAYWITATGLFTLTGGLAPIPTSSTVGAAAGFLIDARDMVAIRWPHAVLMADGQSPLNAGSVQTDLAEEIDQAAWAAMNNVVDPSVVLSINSDIQVDEPELKRIEDTILANRGGTSGRGKLWLLQNVEPKQVHRSPAELDYGDDRKACRDNVLAIHGVSGVSCGIPSETGTYSGYYVQLKQTIELSVQPELDLVAGELTKLFREEYGDEAIEVVISAKSFDDPDVKRNEADLMLRAGNGFTVREFRAKLGYPPLGDKRDDEMVGMRVSVRAQVEDDADPNEPGVQLGEGKDDNADESGTGFDRKLPTITRPNVRQKLNAMMANGHGATWLEGIN